MDLKKCTSILCCLFSIDAFQCFLSVLLERPPLVTTESGLICELFFTSCWEEWNNF